MNELNHQTLTLLIDSKGGTGKTSIAKIISEYLCYEGIRQLEKSKKVTKIKKFYQRIRSKNNVFQYAHNPKTHLDNTTFIHFHKNSRRSS